MHQSVAAQAEGDPKTTLMLTKTQVQPNWGKLPMTNDEPSTASAPTLELTEVGLGVAVAAPPVRTHAPGKPLIE